MDKLFGLEDTSQDIRQPPRALTRSRCSPTEAHTAAGNGRSRPPVHQTGRRGSLGPALWSVRNRPKSVGMRQLWATPSPDTGGNPPKLTGPRRSHMDPGAVRKGTDTVGIGHSIQQLAQISRALSHHGNTPGALTEQTVIKEGGLSENVWQNGKQLATGLRKTFDQHPHVSGIRERGLFWTFEFVADKDREAPFPPANKLAARVQAEAQALGMMYYPAQGCADGTAGDHVPLAPSYTPTSEEIGLTFDIPACAVATALEA